MIASEINQDVSGRIWLDDVSCTGSERRLADCLHAGWGKGNCNQKKDVRISCNVQQGYFKFYMNSFYHFVSYFIIVHNLFTMTLRPDEACLQSAILSSN